MFVGIGQVFDNGCGMLHVACIVIVVCVVGIGQVFDNGCGMLHVACIARNFDAVLYLCNAGINPKMQDKYGE